MNLLQKIIKQDIKCAVADALRILDLRYNFLFILKGKI